MSNFQLEVVTPTKLVNLDAVSYLRCPGIDGLFGVMSHHQAAIIALDIGEIKVTQNNNDTCYATSGGFIDIEKDKISLLLETIEKSDEIDTERANASLERAKTRRGKTHINCIDEVRMNVSIRKAINRLKISKK